MGLNNVKLLSDSLTLFNGVVNKKNEVAISKSIINPIVIPTNFIDLEFNDKLDGFRVIIDYILAKNKRNRKKNKCCRKKKYVIKFK